MIAWRPPTKRPPINNNQSTSIVTRNARSNGYSTSNTASEESSLAPSGASSSYSSNRNPIPRRGVLRSISSSRSEDSSGGPQKWTPTFSAGEMSGVVMAEEPLPQAQAGGAAAGPLARSPTFDPTLNGGVGAAAAGCGGNNNMMFRAMGNTGGNYGSSYGAVAVVTEDGGGEASPTCSSRSGGSTPKKVSSKWRIFGLVLLYLAAAALCVTVGAGGMALVQRARGSGGDDGGLPVIGKDAIRTALLEEKFTDEEIRELVGLLQKRLPGGVESGAAP